MYTYLRSDPVLDTLIVYTINTGTQHDLDAGAALTGVPMYRFTDEVGHPTRAQGHAHHGVVYFEHFSVISVIAFVFVSENPSYELIRTSTHYTIYRPSSSRGI